MKTEAHFLPPSISLFFKCYGVIFPLFYMLIFLIQTLIFNTVSEFFSLNILITALLYALGICVGVTLASRKMKLIVRFLKFKEPVQDWIIQYFIDKGWSKSHPGADKMEFDSKHLLNRVFQWNKTIVNSKSHELVITGPYKIVDDVYSQLKFGQHDFE